MKITLAETTTIDIRLTASLRTGAGGVGDRSGLQVRVHTDAGMVGRGETAPIPGVEGPGLESIAVDIDQWCSNAAGLSLDEAFSGLDSISLSPLARFGVHTALADLAGQAADVPTAQWLRAGAAGSVLSNGLVTDASPGAVHSRTAELVAAGMTSVKLKVGAVDSSQDVTRVIAASEAAGPDVSLRLDANQAWDSETTERVIGRVGRHRVDFIEDPTPQRAGYADLENATGVSIALDLPVTNDPDAAIAEAGVSIVVVKPAAIGGIDRIVDLARNHPERRIIVSSSIDREIGLAAAIHAAASLPDDTEAHGISTGLIVRNMPSELLPRNGSVGVPPGAGIWSLDANNQG